jgi:predicted HNH restriction endonuclease
MTKYQPLAEYLSRQHSTELKLLFTEVEAILEAELPDSAYRLRQWWENPADEKHWSGQSRAWLSTGWKVDKVDFAQRHVTFKRTGVAESSPEHYLADDAQALEGYERDARVMLKSRNAALAQQRREMDDYLCQACGFRLKVGETYVIDVHHLNPLADFGESITSIDELVSLCPTCHRIAHLRKPPYLPKEIQRLREEGQL